MSACHPHKTVAECIELVFAVVKPPTRKEYAPANEWPADCRFCGDPCTIEVLTEGLRARVMVSHDVPVCPEFIRACEDAQ